MADKKIENQNFTELHDRTIQGIKLEIGTDFKGQDLSNHEFYNCVFGKSNFSKANLYNTVFSGSNLSESIFFESIINGTDFRNTNVRPEQLVNARGVESALFDNRDKILKEIEKIKLSHNRKENKFLTFIINMSGDSKLTRTEQISIDESDKKDKKQLNSESPISIKRSTGIFASLIPSTFKKPIIESTTATSKKPSRAR